MNFGRLLVFVLAILFFFVTLAWMSGLPHRTRKDSLIEEWRSGISELGITPVFPPREDVQVGDLYLRIVKPGKAAHSGDASVEYWLGDLQLAEPIRGFYKARFAMPVEAAEKDASGREKAEGSRQSPLPTTSDGIFKIGDPAKRLRNVSFPNLTVASTRSAKLSVTDSLLQFVNTGSFNEAGYNVTVSVPDAEGYGVPDLLIIDEIGKYCPGNFADNVELLTKLSLSGEPADEKINAVTGVYYARSIDYTVSRRNGFGGTASVTPADLDKLKRLLAELAQPKPPDGKPKPADEKGKAAATAEGGGADSTASVSASAAADAKHEQELLARIKDEMEKMTALERPNAPAVAGTVIRSDAQSVTLRRTFSQPIIIGYRSLAFDMDRFKRLTCHPPPSPPPPPPTSLCPPAKICAEPSCLPPSPPSPRPPEAQQVYLVFFDWKKSDLTPGGRQTIATAANQYKAGRSIRVDITGHADTTGSADYNQRLSEQRARAVANALADLGVARGDMTVSGRGKSDLRIPTRDAFREPQNRRVEITVR